MEVKLVIDSEQRSLQNSKESKISNTFPNVQFMNKKEEMKFFLREYQTFEGNNYDYYYIIPFKWLKCWDDYITSVM